MRGAQNVIVNDKQDRGRFTARRADSVADQRTELVKTGESLRGGGRVGVSHVHGHDRGRVFSLFF